MEIEDKNIFVRQKIVWKRFVCSKQDDIERQDLEQDQKDEDYVSRHVKSHSSCLSVSQVLSINENIFLMSSSWIITRCMSRFLSESKMSDV